MRRLNLDQLRAFLEVVERGSFTAAARALNLSQPAITHQIQELERRFKTQLIERLGKRAYATQSGETLLHHARQLLAEEVSAITAMRRFGDGWLERVRIGTSMTLLMYALPPVLRKLKTNYPLLELNLKAGLTSATLDMIKINVLDIGLCALPVTDHAFEVVSLLEDELVAILPGADGANPTKVSPKFMAQLPLILGNKNSALRRTAETWLSRAGSVPKPVMEFDNVEAIKSLVAVGLGASIVPRLSLGDGHIARAKLSIAKLSPVSARHMGLVRLRGKPMTAGHQLVWDALLTLKQK